MFDFLSSYRCLVYCRLTMVFGLSSTYYDVILFVILLHNFIYVGVIQTSKKKFDRRIYQIMIISILNKWNRRYSSYYIIKCIHFISY